MKILLACEESQAVCVEFRKRGHEAFSADIMDCSGPHPEWHLKGDVLDIIKDEWDMMIAFPPCTHLAVSGAKHFKQKIKDGRQQQGIDFFMEMMNAPISKIAIENPVGIMSTKFRKPDQIIHPYHFGDPYSKATCLWLKELPKLSYNKRIDYNGNRPIQKEIVFSELPMEVERGEFITFPSGRRMAKWYNEANNGHRRSKTFPGIAKAMADQWG